MTSQLLAFGRKSLVMPRVMDLNAFLGEMVPMLYDWDAIRSAASSHQTLSRA